jgi:2-phospho-L-lactate guanylyltransferase
MWTLLPVKRFAGSKSRLGCILSETERAGLSAAMLNDVLAALRGVGDRLTIVVITDDAGVAAHAMAAGCRVAPERRAGVNAALDRYARFLAAAAGSSLLVLPADIPMVQREDLELFLEHRGDGIVMVPAIADGGTNALHCAPPGVIGFQFGAGSAGLHHAAATAAGVEVRNIDMPNLSYDIDRPEDLRWLLAHARAGATLDYLEQIGAPGCLCRYQWNGEVS